MTQVDAVLQTADIVRSGRRRCGTQSSERLEPLEARPGERPSGPRSAGRKDRRVHSQCGNESVMVCERGIRSFEPDTRALDPAVWPGSSNCNFQ